MTNGISTYDPVRHDLRRLESGQFDHDAMTDADLDAVLRTALSVMGSKRGWSDQVDSWAHFGNVLADIASSTALTTYNGGPVAGLTVGIAETLEGMGEVYQVNSELSAESSRLARHAVDVQFVLGRRTPDRPSGHVDAPARNYDGDPRNDIEPSLTWDGRPAFETVGERLGRGWDPER